MIKISINGVEKDIKNSLNDITIVEFEALCVILNEETEDILDKYIKLFLILGLTDEDFDVITPTDFIALTKLFVETDWVSTEFQKEIVIDDKTYVAYTGEKFTLSVRDLAKIEKYVKLDNTKYMGEMLAIIYKDTSISREHQYNDEHIKFKADLFRQHVTANIVLPYINLILKDVVGNLKTGLGEGLPK